MSRFNFLSYVLISNNHQTRRSYWHVCPYVSYEYTSCVVFFFLLRHSVSCCIDSVNSLLPEYIHGYSVGISVNGDVPVTISNTTFFYIVRGMLIDFRGSRLSYSPVVLSNCSFRRCLTGLYAVAAPVQLFTVTFNTCKQALVVSALQSFPVQHSILQDVAFVSCHGAMKLQDTHSSISNGRIQQCSTAFNVDHGTVSMDRMFVGPNYAQSGAIGVIRHSTVNITNSFFTVNLGFDQGVFKASASEVAMQDCMFDGNFGAPDLVHSNAFHAAGVCACVDGSRLTAVRCHFEGNYAFSHQKKDASGVINAKDSTVALHDCVMHSNGVIEPLHESVNRIYMANYPYAAENSNNTAITAGVFFGSNSTLLASNVTAVNNNGVDSGGFAVRNSSLLVNDCVFEQNKANHVGSIFADSSYVLIHNCSFGIQVCTDAGSCIAVSLEEGEATIGSTVFSSLSSAVVAHETSVQCNHTQFVNVSAVSMEMKSCPSSLIANCSFSADSHGDGVALLVHDTAVRLVHCQAQHFRNHAPISVWFSEVSLQDSFFEDNSASVLVVDRNSTVLVSDCIFRGNSGECGGVMMARNGSEVIFSKSLFEYNHAQSGGALYLESVACLVTDCLFENNSASSFGGALFVRSGAAGALNFSHSKFLNNAAPFGGALYFVPVKIGPSMLQVSSAVFDRNQATVGAALYVQGEQEGLLELHDYEAGAYGKASAAMMNTTLLGMENAICVRGSLFVVEGSNFSNNSGYGVKGALSIFPEVRLFSYVNCSGLDDNNKDTLTVFSTEDVAAGVIVAENCSFENAQEVIGIVAVSPPTSTTAGVLYTVEFQALDACGFNVHPPVLPSNVTVTIIPLESSSCSGDGVTVQAATEANNTRYLASSAALQCAAAYDMAWTLNHTQAKESLVVTVTPSSSSPEMSHAVFASNVSLLPCNYTELEYAIFSMDEFGNAETTISDDFSARISCVGYDAVGEVVPVVSPGHNFTGEYRVRFGLAVDGRCMVQTMLRGSPIKNSPYEITVLTVSPSLSVLQVSSAKVLYCNTHLTPSNCILTHSPLSQSTAYWNILTFSFPAHLLCLFHPLVLVALTHCRF